MIVFRVLLNPSPLSAQRNQTKLCGRAMKTRSKAKTLEVTSQTVLPTTSDEEEARSVARKVAKRTIKAKTNIDDASLRARSIEEYHEKWTAIAEQARTDREKKVLRNKLQRNFKEYLLRANDVSYSETEDEEEVEKAAADLLGVRAYVHDLMTKALPALSSDTSVAGQCMKAAGVAQLPLPTDFSNPGISLNPWLWPVVIDLHVRPEDLKDPFSTSSRRGGKLRKEFEAAVLESITHKVHGEIRSEPSTTEKNAVRTLSAHLCQIAAHWLSGQEPSATAFLDRWSSLLEESKSIVTGSIMPSMIARLVGEAEANEFAAKSLLDTHTLPPFVSGVLEGVMRRPRFGHRERLQIDDEESPRRARAAKKIKYDPTVHSLIDDRGHQIVVEKATGRRLGRKM